MGHFDTGKDLRLNHLWEQILMHAKKERSTSF